MKSCCVTWTSLLVMLLMSLALIACDGDDSDTDSVDGDEDDSESDGDQITEDGDTETEWESDIEYAFHQVLPIPENGNLADPCVLLVDGVWYLYGTHHQTRGFEVWYSEDLTTWEQGDTIWSPTQPWQTEDSICGMWAPHVEYTGDAFYLYYTANCRIGVARSDSPLGPFVDLYDHPLIGNGYGGVGDGELVGEMTRDWDDLAIDAFLLQASDGSLVIYYTGFTPLSTIYAQRMSDFETTSDEPVLLLEPEVSGWEGLVREGAWVLERDGLFHLMYSGNIYETLDYAIGVATASDPLGPFTRDERNPILQSHVETGIYGPGHHSVAPGAYGDQLIFYHTKVAPEDGEERLVRYGPLWFDDDGKIQVEQP